MIAAKVACPQCKASLKVTQVHLGGQKVKCPRCGVPFSIAPGASEGRTPPAGSSPPRAKETMPAISLGANNPFQDTHADGVADFSNLNSPVRSSRPSRGGKGRLLAGLIVVGVVMVAAGIGVAVLLSSGNKKKPDPGHQGDKAERDGARKDKKADRDPTKDPDSYLVTLPKDKQAKVNRAVERAMQFLKEQQKPEGGWQYSKTRFQQHQVGLAALPALTLLECGLPPTDPVIQKAVHFVRENCPDLKLTYDISLAILLLNRLNDSKDKERIATLAMRLVAGQTGNGGWSYHCPLLPRDEEKQLTTVLKNFPLTSKLELIDNPPPRKDENNKLSLEKPTDGTEDRPDDTKLVLIGQKAPPPKLVRIEDLPPDLQKLPVVKVKPDPKEERIAQRSDNSNTQFATLALWAARRHGLPLDRTLALIVKRFRTSQYATGSWGYGYTYTVGSKQLWVGRDTMACAGLLGLAVGHGLAQDVKSAEVFSGKDPAVDLALRALATGLGKPVRINKTTKKPTYNLYLLWSVERVAMLYKLKKIGKVDWYTWGVDILLSHQGEDGSWQGDGYVGSDPAMDTCLALLFLKRVNLVKDLSAKLVLDVDSN